jgi:hypothetical protein
MAASMKSTVFFVVASCSLVEADKLFRGAYCLHLQRYRPVFLNFKPNAAGAKYEA